MRYPNAVHSTETSASITYLINEQGTNAHDVAVSVDTVQDLMNQAKSSRPVADVPVSVALACLKCFIAAALKRCGDASPNAIVYSRDARPIKALTAWCYRGVAEQGLPTGVCDRRQVCPRGQIRGSLDHIIRSRDPDYI